MAGLEPASRTLIDAVTTLISGDWFFVDRLHRRQRAVPYPEFIPIHPPGHKCMELTCANRSSSAGYAIRRLQSKRIHRGTMASKLTCANQAAIAYE